MRSSRFQLNRARWDAAAQAAAVIARAMGYGFMANVYAPFEQNIFDLTQRKRIADIRHHREAHYFGRAVEITEGIFHYPRLGDLNS